MGHPIKYHAPSLTQEYHVSRAAAHDIRSTITIRYNDGNYSNTWGYTSHDLGNGL